MRVYVAASSKNIPFAQEVMRSVKSAGHTLTHDWAEAFYNDHRVISNYLDDARVLREYPNDEDNYIDPEMHLKDRQEALEVANKVAVNDVEGVESAEVLIFIHSGHATTCAWIELGIAMADRIPIIFYAPPDLHHELLGRVPFLYHPKLTVHFCDNIAQVLQVLYKQELENVVDELLEDAQVALSRICSHADRLSSK